MMLSASKRSFLTISEVIAPAPGPDPHKLPFMTSLGKR
jgi:hypothetical protein